MRFVRVSIYIRCVCCWFVCWFWAVNFRVSFQWSRESTNVNPIRIVGQFSVMMWWMQDICVENWHRIRSEESVIVASGSIRLQNMPHHGVHTVQARIESASIPLSIDCVAHRLAQTSQKAPCSINRSLLILLNVSSLGDNSSE